MYRVVKFIAYWLLKALYRVELHDYSEKRRYDKMLLIANHQSFLDGVLLGAYLPFKPYWVVHSTIWNKWYFRIGLRWLPAVVVDTNSPLAMKRLVNVIDAGHPVAMFPEGRITVTGSMMKIYDGPAFLAARTRADVLCVRIDGALNTHMGRMPWWHPKRLFPKIRITILPARRMELDESLTPRQRRAQSTRVMRRWMQEMLFRTERMMSLHEALLDAIEFYGRHTEVLQDVRMKPETYGHMLKASLALGRLVSRLAQEGETVGVLMPNVTTTASLLFGMFGVRRVPAMLNYTTGSEGVQSACELACIKTVITSHAFIEKARLGSMVNALRDVRIVYLEDMRPQFGLADKLWLVFRAIRNPRRVMKPVDPDSPAIVLFTSGSEAKPKGVVLSHRAILSNIYQMKSVIDFSRADYFLNALPIFHSFGLTVATILPLVSGCRLFLYPTPLHYRAIPELAYDQGCTILFGTPTFLAGYGKVANPYDFYRIHLVVCGAEKLPEEVRRLWLDKFGIRITEGYGATEYAPVIAACTPMAYRAGTCGELLPGIEYKLEAVAGVEEGGVLHLRGPNSMLGYLLHDQPGVLQPPSSVFGEGWYNTGDVVVMDDDFVRIVGRVKRFAKVAGEMVSLEMVEKVAYAVSPRHRHAASTLSEGRRGETIILFTEDIALRREHLVEAASRGGIGDLAVARRVVYLPKIPLLGNGKFDYVRLKSMAEEQATVQ